MMDYKISFAEAEGIVKSDPEWIADERICDDVILEALGLASRYQENMETISRLTAELEVSNAAHAATGRLLAATGRERDAMRKALQGLLHDPEPDLDEPDEDWCVIRKMRESVRAALTASVPDADGGGQ